jgi:outer membrane protein insertion porin family
LSDLRYSAGVGGRWLSPFGPIVVYLGFPLNPLEDEDRSVFEFSFGGGSF